MIVSQSRSYEVGTEESIRRFETEEVDTMMIDLKSILPTELFHKIKYLVIQSGTSLKGNNQTGRYDKSRLVDMVSIAKKYGVLSKEHNGDYIDPKIIKEKFSLGLDCINIAPEFGLIETQTYLDNINDSASFEDLFKLCYESKKWVKWVNAGFDPFNNKEELIKICGHYVISDPGFKKIKFKQGSLDEIVKDRVKNKLYELTRP